MNTGFMWGRATLGGESLRKEHPRAASEGAAPAWSHSPFEVPQPPPGPMAPSEALKPLTDPTVPTRPHNPIEPGLGEGE